MKSLKLAHIDWSLSNLEIARRLGVSAQTLRHHRAKLGHAPFKNRGVTGFRNVKGASGEVYEARRAMNLSRPQFEALSGIDRASLAHAESRGQSFIKVELIRRFNRVVPPQFRMKGFYTKRYRHDGSHAKATIKICERPGCGKSLEASFDRLKRGSDRYCSPECFNQTRIKKIKFVCDCGCGEAGEKIPSYYNRAKMHFIDRSHRTRWHQRHGLPALGRSAAVLGAGLTQAIETGTKYCPKCKQRRAISEFGPDKKRMDGYTPWCRRCKTKSVLAARAKKRAKVLKGYDKSTL